ncbi:Mu transposase C-terminal domain-containing protein [Thioclava sp. F28-4]|uniref:Mu transposase C-terminal domain-containing protein n=1 Tax=Thioclava sp. F28-4 TaxID=1915315 RepID=UPI000998462B|nr:Mu transposase C-terminal domain-containing protein [Thioclava sp. F28-4]
MDGRRWRVDQRDDSAFDLSDVEDGECITLSVDHVERAILNRECDVTLPVAAAKNRELLEYTGGFERLEQLEEDAQREAKRRLVVMLELEALEAEGWQLTQRALDKGGVLRSRLLARVRSRSKDASFTPALRGGKATLNFNWPQGRTLLRYYKLFQSFGRNPVVLADRDQLKGRREPRLSPHQERFIEYVLNRWNSKLQPQLAPLVAGAQELFDVPPEEHARGFCFPSITTIRARLNAISAVVKTIGREGVRHATNRLGAGSTDVRALKFGSRVETDQCYLSIFSLPNGRMAAKVIDPDTTDEELEKDEVRRVWLHFMVDVATREALAWIISETADEDHSAALVRMATRDKTREKIRYGCKHDPAPPVGLRVVSTDNGSAIRNGGIFAALLGSGSTLILGRTYHGPDKPFQESLFGPTQFQVLNFHSGYTGSRPGELKEVNPKGSASLTHDELYGALTRYFIDEYPFRPHRGTGMFGATIRQKSEEVLRLYGKIDPPSQRDRCLHLGVKREATTTSEGVRVFGLPFNSSALQRFADGQPKKVLVHLDPDDLRRVFIVAQGEKEVIEAKLSMTVFNDLTLEEAIEIMEEATRSNPKQRALHEGHLREAIADRARRSGFFPDSRDPSNYQTIAQLEKRAARILGVSTTSSAPMKHLVAPGEIMERHEVDQERPSSTSPPRSDLSAPKAADEGAKRIVLPPTKETKF